MKSIFGLAHCRSTIPSPRRLLLVFLSLLIVTALSIAATQRVSDASLPTGMSHPVIRVTSQTVKGARFDRLPLPTTAFAPTYADAAESLRSGRHADAYGRFVALADEGDADAGRAALIMYRCGPSVFGSDWDASDEQLAQWTQWSAAAGGLELAHIRAMAEGSAIGMATDGHSLLKRSSRCALTSPR